MGADVGSQSTKEFFFTAFLFGFRVDLWMQEKWFLLYVMGLSYSRAP
jgi:hypothetical protein